ncbi:MAG TPA: hypothetical protein VLI41_01475 [Phenylobacterium sp.]|uniref:hypothetical protein n=1 Tax=Phenylobacterium sp. TaxID=1871053 RepID=UPI002CA7081D|nr:hypothetical protein [Phenylobacterium sp.]HSV01849.1 hypothetical protein [Phenylobacterium sp.]
MSIDLQAAKRRLMIMGAIDLAAIVAALAAAAGYFGLHLGWALAAFAGALAIGFGAQIWFIAGLRRTGGGA